jgi:hypothetical protein
VFGRLFGLGYFDNPKITLAHKQTFLPITFGSIRFIPINIIALVAYLGNWAFVTSIIVVRFMVDQHPFLFEALA